ncbi:MAG TPA: pentapeptide repeat-containing protein, partial [Elainellaceae cyanobacterium]
RLEGASLVGARLEGASLFGASLEGARLDRARLEGASFRKANLQDITWDEETDWSDVRGLDDAINVPEALKRQLGLA